MTELTRGALLYHGELALPTEVGLDDNALEQAFFRAARLGAIDAHLVVKRQSIDSRQRLVLIRTQAEVRSGPKPLNLHLTYGKRLFARDVSSAKPVAIVGLGPAGMFAALKVIEAGYKPVVFERGKSVQARRRDLAALNKEHIVDPDSNYCFGEGGAGTYSDGKLYTRSAKRGNLLRILEILVAHGATEKILYEAHPHIGTNKLPIVVTAINQTILDAGGEIHYEERVTDFSVANGKLTGLTTSRGSYEFEACILATGHSARDIFTLLHAKGVAIEAKPFAIGVRAEHEQALIDRSQYGTAERGLLPAAAYSLKTQVPYRGREKGVFSFCMCPGGFIVPSATQAGEMVVNGMSPSRRDSRFSNSGIVVAVDEHDWADFKSEGPLAALAFQQMVERQACSAMGGDQTAPAQLLDDFVADRVSNSLRDTSYQPGLRSSRFKEILPDSIYKPLQQGIRDFGRKIEGFSTDQGQAIGIESRTSSPVRIPRDSHTFMHPDVKGLFPCGEGAGYAGGIVSAAMDGENVAEAVCAFLGK